MVPEIKTVIKKYFVCPNCSQHEFSYGHLKEGQSFGPWCCDHCGHGYIGEVTVDAVEIEPQYTETVKLMALLKFSPELADESEPVPIMLKRVELIFLVKGIRTFCSLELREMTMTRAILESIACFLGSHSITTARHTDIVPAANSKCTKTVNIRNG